MKQVTVSLAIVAGLYGGCVTAPAHAQSACGCGPQIQTVALTAENNTAHAAEAPAEKTAAGQEIFLGNAKCPIMGGKTNPKLFVQYSDPKKHIYARIYECCPGCTEKIKSDPAAAYAKAYLDREVKDKDGAVIAKKGEPLDLKNSTCPVKGGKVSPNQSMIYNGYKIGLCCAACEDQVAKSPEKYLAKLIRPPKSVDKPSEKGDAPATPNRRD